MKKLFTTLSIILGFTTAVSAQTAETKPAEIISAKPVTEAESKSTVTPVKIVKTEKQTVQVSPVKVIKVEQPVAKETPSKVAVKEKQVKSAVVDTDLQFKESKATKQKN